GRRVALGATLARNPTFSLLSVLDAEGEERLRIARAGPDRTTDPPPVIPELVGMDAGTVEIVALGVDETSGFPSLDVIVRAPLDDPGTVAVRAEIVLARAWEQLALRDTVDAAVVYLIDRNGRIVAHPNPSLALEGRTRAVPEDQGFGQGLIGEALVTFEPIEIGNRTLVAVVERPTADVLGAFRSALWTRVAAVVVALVASAIVGVYAARRITEPIESLAATAARLSGGDLTARAHLHRDDEIGLLGDTFDDMATELGRTIGDLEAEVERRTERLRRSNEDLERFATVAAHDLREPLRKVELFADRLTLSVGDDLPPDAAHALSRMVAAVTRMRDMVDDLLELSTIRRGDDTALHPVPLGDVVREALDEIDESVTEAGAAVSVDVLPTVIGNRIQLRRLFVNLLENAVKYARPGIAPVVAVTATARAGAPPTVVITVADNGIGIGDEHRERIFEIFRRLHSQDAYPGTGIGLSICRRIVEQHGGTITARAGRDVGSAFDVTLPAGRAATSEGRHSDRLVATAGEPAAVGDQKRSPSAEPDAAAHRHGRRR
ncbi:MAG: ATP-binding protein, partial [Actinomycetota bacterium]|nr:ATP-binding protein [Actinomycetota bacterium]